MSANAIYEVDIRWGFKKETWQDKSQPLEHVEKLKDTFNTYCKKWIFQLEKGKEGGLHFQAYGNLKTKMRTKSLEIKLNEDFKGISIRPASNKGREALKNYCMKLDTKIDGPWADKEIYRGQDLMHPLLPWQKDLKNYLLGPVQDREIIYLYDEKGNTGKSYFTKYMGYFHKATCLEYATAKDILNLASKNISKIFIFDLTRNRPKDFAERDVWAAIEAIKNGKIINTKYDCNVHFFMPPHVVVFSNFMPKTEYLSQDRWNVKKLPKQGLAPIFEKPKITFEFSVKDEIDESEDFKKYVPPAREL